MLFTIITTLKLQPSLLLTLWMEAEKKADFKRCLLVKEKWGF